MTSDPRWTKASAALLARTIAAHRLLVPGGSVCVCDRWRESSGTGWGDHMADVTLTALADAGLLIPPGSHIETQRSIQGEDHLGQWIAYEHDQSDWWLRQAEGRPFKRLEILTPWRPDEEADHA